MTFKLEINCDNAAFEDVETEVASILAEASEKIRNGSFIRDGKMTRDGGLYDTNGNRVGLFAFKGKRKE